MPPIRRWFRGGAIRTADAACAAGRQFHAAVTHGEDTVYACGKGRVRFARGALGAALAIPYTVFRQSRGYLYGWNWVRDDIDRLPPDLAAFAKGEGYSTRKRAIAAAHRHHAEGGPEGARQRYLRRF